MTTLITLAKPIIIQLKRTHLQPHESFEVKVIALRVDAVHPDIKGFVKYEVDGVIFADSENSTLYDLASLGGAQLVRIRTSNINSIVAVKS
jgi:hypothetical protein